MAPKLLIFAFVILIFIIISLVSCGPQTGLSTAAQTRVLLATPELSTPVNDAAVAAILLTQAQENADAASAATAEMARAQAQTVLNAANATLGVAQTQAQDEADLLAAQLAATAAIVSADADATLVAAAATQAAAQTQDTIRQTQTAEFATRDALALLEQQKQAALVAGTQTAVANAIATQTQIAVAILQNEQRQRDEQMQGSISFLTLVCLPLFVVLLAGLALWGFWRWLRIQQANQRLLESPVEVLPAPQPRTILPAQNDPLYLDDSSADHHPHLTTPENQVSEWLDEVKSELLTNEEKENDNDNANG